jgi:patatin-like phospholipase/acyl hydrolase
LFNPLDGGGIRGLSELLILKEIMGRIMHDERLAHMPRPCDYFDLIGGTSTGGYVIRNQIEIPYRYQPDTQTLSRIIALMLGRLQMSVAEAITSYGTLAERVFSSTKRIGDGKFRASELEKVIKENVKEKLGHPDALMMDPRPEGEVCKTCVVTDRLSHCKIDRPSASCVPCPR